MISLTILSIILLAFEIQYRPRLGFTRANKVLLWYGRNKRNYYIIW